MATKSTDAFFLRIPATHGTATGYEQTSYDIGAYVDALGKSVLRIHNIQVAWQQDAEPAKGPVASASGNDINTYYQLTTQSQAAAVLQTDNSVISAGRLFTAKDSADQVVLIDESANLNPMDYTHGYLVAVDSLFVGVDSTNTANAAFTCALILECTVEKMDSAAAMALALSQQ